MVNRQQRNGGSNLGCLVVLVIAGAGIYLGLLFVRPWFRNEQYQQEMKNVALESATMSDSLIRVRLVARADSLGLPREAKRLTIRRLPREDRIEISARYSITIEIPVYGPKVLNFIAAAEESL